MAAQLKVVGSGLEYAGSMDRQKALEAALAQIDRAFGKGSAMKLGSREKMEIDTISTGSLGLDIALGVGGLPRGRVVEIYGPESSGKTTLALHAIAEAQKVGGTAAFVDAEHALDPGYAKKLGRRHRRADRLAARHRRAGARDRRHAGALERDRRAGGRFGRGAGAAGRDRGRDGRQPRRPPGAADEPGAAQADRLDQPLALHRHLHQPGADEDRRDVRQSGDDDRRQCAEILRLASGSTSAAPARSRTATISSATRPG